MIEGLIATYIAENAGLTHEVNKLKAANAELLKALKEIEDRPYKGSVIPRIIAIEALQKHEVKQ